MISLDCSFIIGERFSKSLRSEGLHGLAGKEQSVLKNLMHWFSRSGYALLRGPRANIAPASIYKEKEAPAVVAW